MKVKNIIIIIFISILMINIVYANKLHLYVKPSPVTKNYAFDYTFNFTESSDCSGASLSFNKSVTTDSTGVGFIELNIENMTRMPPYMCEYRNGAFRKAHYIPTKTYRNVTADRFKGKLNWSYLDNYPTSCAANSYISTISDNPTCSVVSQIDNNVQINGALNVTKNITGNRVYGEMWNYTSNSTAWTFSIASSGVYYNLTGLAGGDMNGFTWVGNEQGTGGSYLLAHSKGTYKLDFGMSFGSTGSGLYGIAVVHNFDVNTHRDCYARRFIGAGGDVGNVGISCLMDISKNDKINIQIEDEGVPVKDLLIHTVNLNLLKIGD